MQIIKARVIIGAGVMGIKKFIVEINNMVSNNSLISESGILDVKSQNAAFALALSMHGVEEFCVSVPISQPTCFKLLGSKESHFLRAKSNLYQSPLT